METSDRLGAEVGQQPVVGPLGHLVGPELLCATGLGAIGLLDLAARLRHWSTPVIGLLDEPAHLVTAALLMAALLPRRARGVVPWALAGAVLIDLDHIPFYLWGALTTGDAGRPLTHSLITSAGLALIAMLMRRRTRTAMTGLALGVLMHLVRDLGTGPGVPLWWPLSSAGVHVPYWAYFATMTLVAVLAAARRRRWSSCVRWQAAAGAGGST